MPRRVLHGGSKFLRTGILPKGKKHIAGLVDSAISEMIRDLGGEDQITTTQKVIISTIRQNLVFLGLVNEWLAAQPSIIGVGGEMLPPLNGFYLSCQNSVTRNCLALGLKRISPLESMEAHLAEIEAAKAKGSAGKPLTKDTRQGENAPQRGAGEGGEL